MSDNPDASPDETKQENPQKRKGFGTNPENINRNGRPLGSRNKSKLVKAQLAFDDYSALAVERLKQIMMNDTKALGVKEVPVSMQVQAAKVIIDKAIANEKDKEVKAKATLPSTSESDTQLPVVYSTAVS
jgi:hypothetical protein